MKPEMESLDLDTSKIPEGCIAIMVVRYKLNALDPNSPQETMIAGPESVMGKLFYTAASPSDRDIVLVPEKAWIEKRVKVFLTYSDGQLQAQYLSPAQAG